MRIGSTNLASPPREHIGVSVNDEKRVVLDLPFTQDTLELTEQQAASLGDQLLRGAQVIQASKGYRA